MQHNKYVTIPISVTQTLRKGSYETSKPMDWNVEYPYKGVEEFILELPPGLQARYFRLATMLEKYGANLGMPQTRAMSNGLFELRIKGKEGIARVFYCTLVGKRIIVLHGFIKKTQKTPTKELKIAHRRLSEVKGNES